MKTDVTEEFIRRIPKTDLHVHLDGSLRLSTLIEFAVEGHVELPSYEEAGLKKTVFKSVYRNLPEYLRCFAYTCAVLQIPENLERAAYELAEDNLAEGVRYIEVRFAPQLHVSEGREVKEVMRAVCRGLERAKARHAAAQAVLDGQDLPFEYGIIVCAMRSFNDRMGAYFAKLLRALPRAPRREVFAIASLEIVREAVELRDEESLPIVGFDLAGEEAGYPAAYHSAAYQYAHSHFMKKTVHAGEAYGPESIFQAITECHTNRIGHGTFLFSSDEIRARGVADPERYVEALADYIASQRITIEACLTSNLQTIPRIRRVEDHSLGQMLEHNMSVSICTDNRLVSNTTVTRELGLVARHFALSRHTFRNLVTAGFKGSFFPGSYRDKRACVRRVLDRYEALEQELL